MIDQINWNDSGLVNVICQDVKSARILMQAWMNEEALSKTLESGFAVYWSRSRQKLWEKGEESGHRQKIIDMFLDCDGDVILLKVEQIGGIACHTGRESCFYRKLIGGKWVEIDEVLKQPEEIYAKIQTG